MSDWSQGYPTDSAYIDAIQVEINPWRWQQSMLFSGRACPSPRAPFRFLELGCGSAMTLIALACSYPQAKFTGYDFMPEHIVTANRLIREIGLTNIEVREGAFAEMIAEGPGEKYDFAAAHGVWSWVPPEVRSDIVTVLNGWLGTGAVTYFGYNAAAGWAAAGPIRQIFRRVPRGRGERPFAAARAAVDLWLEQMGDMAPQAAVLWQKLKDAPDHFLAHEIGSEFGTGIWMEDLAEPLGEAKMTYAGPAVLAEHMDALFLEDEGVEMLRRAVDEGWGETARDLLHRRTFRNDLYHRGAPTVSGTTMLEKMRALRLIAWDEALNIGTHPSVFDQLKRGVDERVLLGFQELCAGDGAPFGACMEAVDAPPMAAFQAVMTALVSGGLMDLRPKADVEAAQETCDRFNAAMMARLRRGGHVPGFAAPGYGGCVQFSRPEQRAVLLGETEDEIFHARLEKLGVRVR
ncbi:class I SAM-dependent methyltransferase [Sagittula salina]|uniref:Methyltransferase regulatory domain-containing protein n=1 Tax=Sagittula salina TaxID=2820268 RepID=A0A940S031_9RHOB|nr:class I SAM-dependent methyltransferase [Sagittula salina]MBP0482613.1 methyltransferase regulatory domain-containing protein [Sagittula salina]